MIGPLTLAQQLRAWRRRGCQCRLDDMGHLRSRGLKKLASAERDALSASAPMVLGLLLQRRAKRRKRTDEEQHHMATVEPQQPRRVVGQIVQPGRPLRLLYEDECKRIDVQRARVLGTVPYGWRKS